MKRVDLSKMDDLREEPCIEKCVIERLVKSRMKWAGHNKRMDEACISRLHTCITGRAGEEGRG